jgi:hypothetical protein
VRRPLGLTGGRLCFAGVCRDIEQEGDLELDDHH